MASRRQRTAANKKERKAELLDGLMHEHRVRFVRQACFHSERRQDAEDALGDACVQFLLHFEGEDEDDARRWMLVVVRRCAWAIARRRRERRAVVEEVSAEHLAVGASEPIVAEARRPEELAEASEEVAAFAAALSRLTVDERRAISLLAVGYSYAEIGARYEWTRSKVNRSLAEGRARLRRALVEGGESL
jgi:RNA polymerase sigma factor (sigma-70 family)